MQHGILSRLWSRDQCSERELIKSTLALWPENFNLFIKAGYKASDGLVQVQCCLIHFQQVNRPAYGKAVIKYLK